MWPVASDESLSAALPEAVEWVVGLLEGRVATTAAVLAIAAIGLAMLAGRPPVRRALAVIVGCFVLFSAAAIARGLTDVALREPGDQFVPVAVVSPAYTPTPPRAAPFDPYAGASVPTTR